MKGYKGFNPGLICREKQYKENAIFEEEEAIICNKGMHFCRNPLDVFNYYPLINDCGEFNDFAEVESLGEVSTDDNKKFCTTKLKIGKKLSFIEVIEACINSMKEKNDYDFKQIDSNNIKEALIVNSNINAKISNLRNQATIINSGAACSLSNSGSRTSINNLGYCAKIANMSHCTNIGNSGHYVDINSSGRLVIICNTGNFVQISSTGNNAIINSSGEKCIIYCTGIASVVKAKKGTWITLTDWSEDKETGEYIPSFKTQMVDGEIIKEDTFYTLKDGEFIEVKK